MEEFSFVTGFEADSASPTDIWKIRKKSDGTLYILKLFVTSNYTRLLLHEQRVYEYLTDVVVRESNARNFLPLECYGQTDYEHLFNMLKRSKQLSAISFQNNFRYNTMCLILQSEKKKERLKINDQYQFPSETPHTMKWKGNTIDFITDISYGFICTPYIENIKFATFVNDEVPDISELINYLFIIFVNIHLMEVAGVNQNDLHWGNIMMAKKYYGFTEYHQKDYLIVTNSSIILVDNEYTPIMFDWDRSAIHGEYMTELDGYKYAGNCPEFAAKRDSLKTICSIYHYAERRIKYAKTPAEKQMFRTFRDEMMDELILSNSLRVAVADKSNRSCYFETNTGVSTLCKEADLNKVADMSTIVYFFLQRSSYKVIDFSVTELSEDFIRPFIPHKNKDSKDDYILANIQYIGKFTEEQKKDTFKKVKNGLKSKWGKYVDSLTKLIPKTPMGIM